MGKLLSILGVLFLCSTCAAIAQVKERPVPPVAAWAACAGPRRCNNHFIRHIRSRYLESCAGRTMV